LGLLAGPPRSYDSGDDDVALSALRDASGRGIALLGLPSFVDRLFDLPALSPVPRGEGRLLRA
jgi:hypothetical protein